MEKKKLLLVAISVGVFLVLTIGAALLVFAPKNTNLPFEIVASNSNPVPNGIATPSTQPQIAADEQQPSSFDAADLLRNPGGVPGLLTPPEGANGTGGSAETVITVTQPTTAAVPTTPPAGRAANQSAPAAARPAQTTATPAQTAPAAPQTTSTPTQTSPSPAQTASTPAQTASRPAQTTPVQTTPVALSQPSPSAQAKIYDDYWVQTGAFSTMATAEGVKSTLASKGITSIIENGNVNGRTLFRVRVGPYTSQKEANYWLALIKSMDGFEDSQVRLTQNLR